jgi:hypothetical protein
MVVRCSILAQHVHSVSSAAAVASSNTLLLLLQVRVQVGEEDGQRLFPGVQGAMDHVWDYLPDKLAGLNLAGRQYQFLVYSSR